MQIKIEKIVPEGKSMGRLDDGKVVFVWGGLPGEIVEINITKNKKDYAEAEMVNVIKGAEERVSEKEEHYLICSPLQSLKYENQIKLKKMLLLEALSKVMDEKVKINNFYQSSDLFGYRTKMEYSFTTNKKGEICLAFHKRGLNNLYQEIEGCILGSDKVNLVAQKIVTELNKIPGIEAKGLKSLIIRESKFNNQIIVILLHKFREYNIVINLKQLHGLVDGILVGYSTIKSPISVITEVKYKEGIELLEEKINNLTIDYPFDGFFQNNLPMFEKALEEINNATPACNKLVELYCGVGTIGLALSSKAKKIIASEISETSVLFAKLNAEKNKISNYSLMALPDHKLPKDLLSDTDVLVLDPPRAGLHPKTTQNIIENLPEKIVYLSCNPNTQARDYNDLKDYYNVEKIVGFDFYPNTLHMESLLVLKKKS